MVVFLFLWWLVDIRELLSLLARSLGEDVEATGKGDRCPSVVVDGGDSATTARAAGLSLFILDLLTIRTAGRLFFTFRLLVVVVVCAFKGDFAGGRCGGEGTLFETGGLIRATGEGAPVLFFDVAFLGDARGVVVLLGVEPLLPVLLVGDDCNGTPAAKRSCSLSRGVLRAQALVATPTPCCDCDD
jgi:hypothetical protein